MRTIDFRFITDPGHGWLEVPFSALQEVGMFVSDFSRCSYRQGRIAYLEEDCDANKFIDRYQSRFDHSPHITEHHIERDCFVRLLPSIRAGNAAD